MKRTFDQVSLCLLKQGNKQALKVFWERLRRRLPSLKTRPPRQAGQHPRIDSDDEARDLRTRFVAKHLGCQARLIRILPWRVIRSRIGVQKNYTLLLQVSTWQVYVCVCSHACSLFPLMVRTIDWLSSLQQEILSWRVKTRNHKTEWHNRMKDILHSRLNDTLHNRVWS